MKAHKKLFSQILTFENLLLAAQKAAAGKREQFYVMDFFYRLEENLWRLQEELQTQTYQPGDYSTFKIYEPKPRMISAAPFRDRVVHHALINVISPLFERSFIFDSYANRVDKGTHRAIRRYQHFLRDYRYVLTGFSHPPAFEGGKRAPLQTAPAVVAGISAGQSRATAGKLGGTCGAGGHLLFIAGVVVAMAKFSASFQTIA